MTPTQKLWASGMTSNKQEIAAEKEKQLDSNTQEKDAPKEDSEKLGVNQLHDKNKDSKSDTTENNQDNIDYYIEQAESIRDMAKSIHSGYISISSSSSILPASKRSTFTNLKQKRAFEIMQSEQHGDMDSVNDPETKEAGIKTIIQNHDEESVSSSITGITDNTGNKIDTYNINSDTSLHSAPSSVSLNSFKESDLDKLIDGKDLDLEELERTVNAATAQWKIRASQKAERYIALAKEKEKSQQVKNDNKKLSEPEENMQNQSPVKGTQKDTTVGIDNFNKQSNSSCDAASQE